MLMFMFVPYSGADVHPMYVCLRSCAGTPSGPLVHVYL